MLNSLQVCRAVAALLVVIHHGIHHLQVNPWFGPHALWLTDAMPSLGQSGVVFFFVLSGFIVLHAHRADVDRPERLANYLLRRLVRIYPTFMLVFGIVWVLSMAVPAARAKLPDDPAVLLQALLLIPQDPQVVGNLGAPLLIVAWSLHLELLFYLSFGLLVLDRRLFMVLSAAFLGQQLLADSGAARAFPHSFIGNELLLLFLFGMAARTALELVRLRRRAFTLTAALSMCGLFWLVAGQVVLPQLLPAPSNLALGGLFAVLVFGLAGTEGAGRSIGAASRPAGVHADSLASDATPGVPGSWARLSRLALQIGAASYSIYLLHVPVVWVLCVALPAALPGAPAAVAVAMLVLVTISAWVGWGFHRLVEKPVVGYLQRLISPASVRWPVLGP
jgi:peptidoglycan/LPS O-acetylase OafA/YrhL